MVTFVALFLLLSIMQLHVRRPLLNITLSATLGVTLIHALKADAETNVSAVVVFDKAGVATVRARLRNDSARSIVASTNQVRFYAALAPSDPNYNGINVNFETLNKDFHELGDRCIQMPNGHGPATVTTADGKTTTVSDGGPHGATAEPPVAITPYEVVSSHSTKLLGAAQHFDDYHCGDNTPHDYRVYGVIPWVYQGDHADPSHTQFTTTPTITVSIP